MHWKWMRLSLIQNLKSVTFWMLLASFLLMLGMLHYLTQKHEDSGLILVYNGDSKQADRVIRMLADDSYHGFSFEEAESKEQLKDAVYRADALCGIVFTDRFDQAVESGNPEESVILYSAPDSAVNVVIRELLFPPILQLSSNAMLSSYLEARSTPETDTANRTILSENERLIKDAGVKLFTVNTVRTEKTDHLRHRSYTVPLCILLLSCVFVMTCFEGKKSYRDFLSSRNKQDKYRYLLENAAVRTGLLMIGVIVGNAMMGV